MCDGDEISVDHLYENVVTLSGSVIENCIHEAITKTSFRLAKNPVMSGMVFDVDENFPLNTNRKSGLSYRYPSARTIDSAP